MRILIDSKFLTHPQVGGFKTYVECLVAALLALPGREEYVLCVDRQSPAIQALASGRCSVKVARGHLPIIREVVREQFSLARAANIVQADLVHFPCNTGSLRIGLPFVLTLHDVLALNNPYFHFERPLSRSIWAYTQARYQASVIPVVARRAAAILTVSEYEKSLITKRLSVPEDSVHVTYLAPSPVFKQIGKEQIAETHAHVRTSFGLEPGYILSVGSKPSKNIPGLVQAYAVLRTKLPSAPQLALVVPHSVTEQTIRKTVSNLGLSQYVRILPGVSQAELCALYNASSVFCFPSFRESFGLPPLEAMACGTPTVVARSSSLPEVVGDASVLVDPLDVEDIAHGMWTVLTSPELRRDLSAKGMRRAARFTWEETARQTLAVYQAVMEKSGATGGGSLAK